MSKRIVFQGDSITDCKRKRDDFYDLGNGYVNLVKASLGLKYPGEYEFINRGAGGDKIVDMYARIKRDIINLNPDYLSILIGVNDSCTEIERADGVSSPKFEKIYNMFIEEIKESCPNTKIIILTPFIVEGSATQNTEDMPDKFEKIRVDVAQKAEIARKIAKKYDCTLIELQPAFDKACAKAETQCWSIDGVHPTICGHEIIKELWIETFEKICY